MTKGQATSQGASTKIVPSPGDPPPHLIDAHGSMDPPESTTETPSQLVQIKWLSWPLDTRRQWLAAQKIMQ